MQALKRAGKKPELLMMEDEENRLASEENRLTMYATIERFLEEQFAR